MQHRERDKSIGIVVLTRAREQGINRWPNIEILVEDSKHIHDDSCLSRALRGVTRIPTLKDSAWRGRHELLMTVSDILQ